MQEVKKKIPAAMAGRKKKSQKTTESTPASTSAAPRTATFTVSDLRRRLETNGTGWDDQLAAEADLDLDNLWKDTGGQDHFTVSNCYAFGCLAVAELLKQGRVQADPREAPPEEQSSSLEALSEIKQAAEALATTRASLDEKLDQLSTDVAAVQHHLQEAKEAPKAAQQALEAKKEGNRSILIAGLVPEGVSGQQAAEQVAEFVKSQVQPALPVDVVSVARMGRFSEQMQGSRRLKV